MAGPRFAVPVLTSPSSQHRSLVDRPGGSCAVRISLDRATVLKSAMTYDCTGFDDRIKAQYDRLSRESAELLEREKEIYRVLDSHDGILECLDINDTGLLFPFLPRGDLRHVLRTERSLSPALRKSWTQAVVASIVYVHSKGVLISDISARNVLVKADNTLVLCDFSGSGIGDRPSMVLPETRYAKLGDGRLSISMATEVFAIGSLLYEIVTGASPYEDLSDDEVEERFRSRNFPDLRDVAFSTLIQQCWLGSIAKSTSILHEISSART